MKNNELLDLYICLSFFKDESSDNLREDFQTFSREEQALIKRQLHKLLTAFEDLGKAGHEAD